VFCFPRTCPEANVDPAQQQFVHDATSPTHLQVPPATANEDPITWVFGKRGTELNQGRDAVSWPRVRGYEILSAIGSGGMGVVYKARHRHLRRTVALKTIRAAALADPEFLQRFHAEAEAVARLQHPNIIQVFEIGTAEPGLGEHHAIPFIALEFVDGGNLSQRAATPQAPRYAAGMVEKLALAVHAAHRLGVIHRDLKPANVLLTADGEPKIADFGLAKQLCADRDEAGRCLTQAGAVMGTPQYMAPEQVSSAPPTPAVDVYALGVILYKLLTARVPFQAASALETMDLVRSQEPVSPRRLQPKLPRDLETICLKCLEKDPARRYASAEALADDLRRFLDDRPIQARRVSAVERYGRWCRRNPLPAALLAAVVAIFLTAFVLVTSSYWRSEAARQALAEQRDEAQRREKAERWERYRANIVASANALQVDNAAGARLTLEAAPQEHRNWEWRYFRSRLDGARHVLDGFPADTVSDAEMSQDGARLVMVAGGGVRVWDMVERRVILTIGASPQMGHVHLSPDGRTLAYRRSDKEVVLHDVDADRVRAVLRGHEKVVHGVRFAPGGRRLITWSHEQPCRVWDVQTGSLVRLITPEKQPFFCVSISADCRRMTAEFGGEPVVRVLDVETGRLLVSVPTERNLESVDLDPSGERLLTIESYPSCAMRLWEAATGRPICVMKGHTNVVTRFAWSPDGSRLASASRDQTVGLWDTVTGRCIAMLRGHRGWVSSVCFSPDGKRLLSTSNDHTLRVWDTTTGEALAVLTGHTGVVVRAGYTADGATILSGSRDGSIRLWDARAVENSGILRGHTTFVYGVAFHPDGERVASASWDGTVRIWNATTGRQLALLKHEDRAIVTSVAFHPSGEILATRSRRAVRLWDVSSGREIHRWNVRGHGYIDSRLAFSARGDRLAVGCEGGAIRVWDTHSHRELYVLREHEMEHCDVAFSPDGRWLASVAGNAVHVWDAAGGKKVQTLEGHTGNGHAVAFNSNGTRLASGATDGTVRLWDVTTWKEIAVLKHGINVYGVAFTPDGTRVACACADNSIRLWDVGTRQEVADLRGHGAYVHQVAFSPDGTRLVSASGDHSLRVWDTLSAQERASRTKARNGQ
jgi:WD40 repeat protein